ncbi:alpha/beta fold hydrolase [Larsenimonas rhizosphaerae]|uniref:Alpha/beta fold hydrolase n=1 Tax=Larsenimonas rhizosphaerae TaxID=2944682 RepID=A0AA41ZGL2_9GAMM|nr:alpha/beta fold hydrolase [Larsenimonas rhizosphaerae]MCM2130814.1 alpha/beta fold hydrolase [Larsenimonas rhizosphaerae]MCX2523518.1 alpha/beta fold hydrolase [Larsenimonas rhizosphaerae]
MSIVLHALDEGRDTSLHPPLVILHGLMGSADNWRSHVKHWQAHGRVIALDLRNHGQSPHAEGMSYKAMAQDVLATLERLEVKRCYLLGHSMGGKVAMTVARLSPETVERLVVADIAPLAYQHGHDDVFSAMREVERATVKTRQEADELMAHHVDQRMTRQFLATNLVREAGQLVWRVGLDNIETDYPRIIAAPDGDGPIDMPSLLIRGGASPYVNDEGLAAANALMTALDVETLEGAGHWIHAEMPERFRQCVEAFLTR